MSDTFTAWLRDDFPPGILIVMGGVAVRRSTVALLGAFVGLGVLYLQIRTTSLGIDDVYIIVNGTTNSIAPDT